MTGRHTQTHTHTLTLPVARVPCFPFFLQLLRPEEVEMLVCGIPELDMSALQKAAQYEGYGKTETTVR